MPSPDRARAGRPRGTDPAGRSLRVAFPPPPPGWRGWPWTAEDLSAPGPGGGRAWPRVSVITPSYQQGGYLEETIRSVLLQGYPNLEYTVEDGGSTDGTLDVIRAYEPWLSAWRSGPDAGQSDAINRGWRRATGEILAWVNSDDVYLPGALTAAARAFARHPDAVVVYGRSIVVGPDGDPTGDVSGRPFRYRELLEGRNPVAQPSAFIRAAALRRTGLLDEGLRFAMDWELWLRLGALGPVVFVDEPWSRFRLHPQSKSGGGKGAFHEEIHRVLLRARRDGRLADRPRSERRRILARSHLRMADVCYRGERSARSRRHAARAVLSDPRLLLGRRTRRRALRSLLGRDRVARWKRRGRAVRG